MSGAGLYVTRWGEQGPRVVLVHGSAQGSSVGGDRHFALQRRLGERGWQVIVPDRPGHGLSPSPGRPDDAELDALRVVPLLEGSAHLVGHSFGSCVALAVAARQPGAVRSLTLIEPAMMPLALPNPHVLWMLLRLAAINLLPMKAANRAVRFSELLHIPPDIRGGKDAAELERMGNGLRRLRVPSDATLKIQLHLVRDRQIPLLVMSGGWSKAMEATADAVCEQGGGSRGVIPSPHHFPQLVSDEFNEKLADFMREADAAGRVSR